MGRKIGRKVTPVDAALGLIVVVLLAGVLATAAMLRARARGASPEGARAEQLAADVTSWWSAVERLAGARLEGRLELALGFDRTTAADIVLNLEGHHDLATGAGALEIQLAPLRFGERGPRLDPLFPILKGVLTPIAGSLEAQGRASWGAPKSPGGTVDVALRNLTVKTEAVAIERLNGVLRLGLPWPPGLPSSPPGQVLAMARVDVGLELRDGLVSFRLRPDGVVEIESASWQVAGGQVRTAGDLDLGAAERRLLLRIEAVSLADLLAIVKLEGLSGEGQISGTLPITISATGPEVHNGHLAARPGGRIRYTPAQGVAKLAEGTPGFEVLLPALRDFHFEELTMELDGGLREELELSLSLEGANPNYLDGHPVRLNLNVDARLADLLEAGEWIYEIPERVERQLERFGGDRPPGRSK